MLADNNNQPKVNIWHQKLQGAKNESPANAEHVFDWKLQDFPFIACLQIQNTCRNEVVQLE
jgi:hypothetical protein